MFKQEHKGKTYPLAKRIHLVVAAFVGVMIT